jgi:hypothetical protein
MPCINLSAWNGLPDYYPALNRYYETPLGREVELYCLEHSLSEEYLPVLLLMGSKTAGLSQLQVAKIWSVSSEFFSVSELVGLFKEISGGEHNLRHLLISGFLNPGIVITDIQQTEINSLGLVNMGAYFAFLECCRYSTKAEIVDYAVSKVLTPYDFTLAMAKKLMLSGVRLNPFLKGRCLEDDLGL